MRNATLLLAILGLAIGGCDRRPPETVRTVIGGSPIIVLAEPRAAPNGSQEFVAREIWLHSTGSPFTPELGRPVPLPRLWAEHWGKRGTALITYSVEGPLAWPNGMRPVGANGAVHIGGQDVTPEEFKRGVLNYLAERSRAIR